MAIKIVHISDLHLGNPLMCEGVREIRGFFELRHPLGWDREPFDFWYSARIQRAIKMKRANSESPDVLAYERVDVTIRHPCDQLTVAVEFPGYRVTPRISMRGNNYEPLAPETVLHSFEVDEVGNWCSLTVKAPKLLYKYGIRWIVP